ncbi:MULTISPECIES: DoxX family membrane protein [unclassified Spirosoma]|uniref:DoxX family protein n=1 Tax=unclassified Spirosoma TaxID=2621999 RepID=UPI000959E59B|nr:MULTISPECIES: DoxX family membrane protein [unclassified Spirosoma]MBN8821227.1 DoxX family membrane protein [Spirosoma sp.]OJW79146.1 MAG: DoxX family protein [Spirosoma sp. 48-14]
MNKFFSAEAIWQEGGLALIRIIVGLQLVYHGWEVFDPAQMKVYAAWDTFKQSDFPLLMVYLGKGSELVAGILLTLGLLTRVGCLITIGTMLYITFIIGHGKFWYEDQHPFLFVLLALVFLVTGGGQWSADALLFGKGLRR